MDFAKAFDKVSHKHLMYKISYYGINCNAFHWIKDFLTDRTQTVILEGETSNKIPVTSGVPQGTVLGPILFLIFINDLAEYVQHSTLRLFADDSIIYKQIKNKEDVIKLQQDLDAAGKWEQDWLMHFHPDKCTVVSVTQKRKTISHTYQLHGHTLEKADSANYLDITIQNNLKWDKHINTITAKPNQSLGFIKRNLKVHSPAIKEHAFKALVRPKLEYCNTIWDPHTQQQKLQIEKIQRRAARYVSNRYHNTSSVTDMMSDLKWAPLEVRRIRYRLVFFYKVIHHLVAIPYSNPNSFRHIQTSKDCYKYSYFPRSITLWNQLPTTFTTADTVDGFKSMIPVSSLIPIFTP